MATTRQALSPHSAVALDQRSHQAVAPVWHTIVLLAIVLTPLIQAAVSPQRAASNPPSHVTFYLSGEIFLALLLAWTWFGLRLRKVSIETLIGGRWSSWRQTATDFGYAFAFWAFWYVAETAVKVALVAVGITNTHASGMLFPVGGKQVVLWILCSVTAGVVEELVFRGYLMQQFSAWTGYASLGLLFQALLFGVAHGFYLGTRQVVIITVSGLLIGGLTLRRKNLRAAMIFHAWADTFGATLVRGLPFA